MNDAAAIMLWIFLLVGGGIGALIYSALTIRRLMKKRYPEKFNDDSDNNAEK